MTVNQHNAASRAAGTLVRLRVGDVIVHDGCEAVVEMVNECRARCRSLSRVQRTVVNKFTDETKTFYAPAKTFSISNRIELGEIVRNDKQLVQPDRNSRKNNMKTNKETSTSTTAPKSTPPAKKPAAAKKQEEQAPATIKNLFNCSGTSVLRRLGKEGLSTAHVRAIRDANKWELSDTTISIQVNNGKNGKGGDCAELTKAQVKEIKDSAEDPAIAKEREAKEKAAAEKAAAKADGK